MKARINDIEVLYKRTKGVYTTVMDRIIDRRVVTPERYKELCKLAEKLGYAIQHFDRFRRM